MEGRKKVGNKFGKRQHMGHWMEQWAAMVKTRLADKRAVFACLSEKRPGGHVFFFLSKIWYIHLGKFKQDFNEAIFVK